MKSRIFLALDFNDKKENFSMAEKLADDVDGFKVGYRFFFANGRKEVLELSSFGKPIFLDLKLHDIPETVSNAVEILSSLPVAYLTLHVSGGEEMLKKSVEARNKNNPDLALLGVTLLTSLNQDDMEMLGMKSNVEDIVLKMATMAKKCNLDGVVCSSLETDLLRKTIGNDFLIVNPAIRTKNLKNDDQKRIGNLSGEKADIYVVGRSVILSKNPRKELYNIKEFLQ